MENEKKRKIRTNITIDRELHQKARDLGLNISRIAEKALREVILKLEGGMKNG